MAQQNFSLGDIFTGIEGKRAMRICRELDDKLQAEKREVSVAEFQTVTERLVSEVIAPAIDRINEQTGQQNDPLFLAYAIQHIYLSVN